MQKQKSDQIDSKRYNEMDDNRSSYNGKRPFFKELIAFDVYITTELAVCASSNARYGFLRPFMVVLEYSCHGVPWILGVVIAVFLTHEAGLHQKQINLLLGLMIDLLVSFVLKASVRRKRPAHNQQDMFGVVSVDHFSFPSGHATRAGLLAVIFCVHFPEWAVANALIVIWSLAVTISRVMLGRHHVCDVICGYIIGLLQYQILKYVWLDEEVCNRIIGFIEEDFHL